LGSVQQRLLLMVREEHQQHQHLQLPSELLKQELELV
jgi:hypothetical protein